MARRRTDDHWVERVNQILANRRPRPSAEKIAAELADEAAALGRNDSPSSRTVERLRDKYNNLMRDAQRAFRYVSWPQSFLQESLPWEASRAVLGYCAWLDHQGFPPPTARVASWYYRVTLAAPDLEDIQECHSWANTLANAEHVGRVDTPGVAGIAMKLAYRPWSSPEAQAAYDAATTRQENPLPRAAVLLAPDLGFLGPHAADLVALRRDERGS